MMIYTFHNTHTVMKAGKICYKNNITAKVIPTPRNISSDCGVSLRVADESITVVDKLFKSEGLLFECFAE